MRIALWIVGGLIAVLLTIALIGAFVPREHVATSAVRLRAKPEDVWALVVDGTTWPLWQDGVTSMERLPDAEGRPRWKMKHRQGEIVTEVVESVAPRRYVTRITDETLPYGGRWIWEIEPTPEGCRVAITEDGFIRNVVFRALARFVFGYHGTQEATLQSLARKVGDPDAKVERVR
jgi:hypothetical protein